MPAVGIAGVLVLMLCILATSIGREFEATARRISDLSKRVDDTNSRIAETNRRLDTLASESITLVASAFSPALPRPRRSPVIKDVGTAQEPTRHPLPRRQRVVVCS